MVNLSLSTEKNTFYCDRITKTGRKVEKSMQIDPGRKRNKIAIFSVLSLILTLFVSFLSRPIKGDTEINSIKFLPGLLSDPFELYESLPTFVANPDFSFKEEVNFAESFPQPWDQGSQRSSTGFAVAYGLISFFEAERLKLDNLSKISPDSPNGKSIFYSPAYIYNQLILGRDSGASLLEALVLAQSRGAITLSEMNYNPAQFRNKPGANQIEKGRKTRISQIYKLDPTDLISVKYGLSLRNPVLISFLAYDNFLSWSGKGVYSKFEGEVRGAQSLIILGYDDSKHAFFVWNSWGKNWGDDGYAWIDYTCFQTLTRSAFIATTGLEKVLTSEAQIAELLTKQSKGNEGLPAPTEIFASKGEFKDRIRLIWSKIDQAIGYEIYRKRKDETKYKLIGLAKQHTYEDTGVQSNLAYTYRIASVDELQISTPSPESNEGYASEETKITEVLPVTNLEASIGKFNDRIVLYWDQHLTADSYSVYKWNTSSKIFRYLGKSDKPTFTDFKANRNGDSEIYRVFPNKKGIMGDGSSYAQGYLDPLQTVKLKPTRLYATKGEYNHKIVLSWEPSPNAESYLIFRSPKGENDWEKLTETKDTRYTDTNLKDPDYLYSVISKYEDQSYSLPSEIERGYAPLIAKRGDLSSTVEIDRVIENLSKREVTISWKNLTKYEKHSIFLRKSKDSKWKSVASVDGKLNQYTVTLPELNQFFFLSIRSKEVGKEESLASKPVITLLNEPVRDTKKVRAFGESTITKFMGPWTAMYWDGKSSVKPIKLEIQSDGDDGFVLRWNNQEFFRGNYIIDSNLLEEKGKWKIQLSPNLDSLSAEVAEKNLLPEKGRLSFVRE